MALYIHPRHDRRTYPHPTGPGFDPTRARPRSIAEKPDRLIVGLLAGIALFYLFGKAVGLGRT